MATDYRPYQGYPYNNPTVFDVPSISADDAARYQHLPRRQIEMNVTRDATSVNQQANLPAKRDSVQEPVVYIEMPETNGSIVADRRPVEQDFEMVPPRSRGPVKQDPDAPVVYIDMPGQEQGGVVSREHTPDEPTFVQRIPPRSRRPVKQDPDAPVVYIDMPGQEQGGVVSREQTPDEPTFVQETIFYDPFENRRIDRAKDSDDDDDDPSPPRRPNFLDLNGAGPSGSTSYSSPIPSMMSKEATIYSARSTDDFPASPIPVSQFPEPPPSYAEIDRTPVVDQPRPRRTPSPPRTQVIVPSSVNSSYSPQVTDMSPMGVPNPDRKYLNCHHCGMRVHALVIFKTGGPTHLAAAFCMLFACVPIVYLIYTKDTFKVRNHYCPNCNNVIGYQGPLSDKIIFVNST